MGWPAPIKIRSEDAPFNSLRTYRRSVVFRFIWRERARGLREADMLIPLGVALKDSKSGGQHVHQPVVSRVRHTGLPIRPHGLHRGTGGLHHPPGAQDLPVLGLRV